MNKFICIANLCKDPELRYTQSGKAVVTLNLAINSGYGDKKETLFMRGTAWEKTAESCNTYLTKGKKVAIEGRLQENKFKDKDGNEKSTIQLQIERIEFLSPKEEGTQPPQKEVQQESGIEEEIIIPGEEEMF